MSEKVIVRLVGALILIIGIAAAIFVPVGGASGATVPDHRGQYLSLGWDCHHGTCTTCKPGATRYEGAFRIYDNAPVIPGGRLCVSSDDHGYDMRLLQNVPAGSVVNPQIVEGWRPGDADPQSPFPMPVTQTGGLELQVVCAGHVPADSVLICDTDMYFGPHAAWPGDHPLYEVVVVNRSVNWSGQRPDGYVTIYGVRYSWLQWITGGRAEHGTWPILVLRRAQADAALVPVDRIVWHVLHMPLHWQLPRSWLLLNVRYNPEIRLGGKGLRWRVTPVNQLGVIQ